MSKYNDPSRRAFLKFAIAAASGATAGAVVAESSSTITLFDGKSLDGWIQIKNRSTDLKGWIVKHGAMASTGAARGVIYTARDYSRFRLMFTMRHVSGNPDHQACVLIFCTRPQAGELPLDALGGIQFQPPLGGHWDYRLGQNNAGAEEFTRFIKPAYDPHKWSRVEILADASAGTARMAVAQPVGSRGQEILGFKNPAAGKVGPIAWQMHNRGLFDEYKNVTVETDPKINDLVTVK